MYHLQVTKLGVVNIKIFDFFFIFPIKKILFLHLDKQLERDIKVI